MAASSSGTNQFQISQDFHSPGSVRLLAATRDGSALFIMRTIFQIPPSSLALVRQTLSTFSTQISWEWMGTSLRLTNSKIAIGNCLVLGVTTPTATLWFSDSEQVLATGHCDICNTKRCRSRVYIVADRYTGVVSQVGASCLRKRFDTTEDPMDLSIFRFLALAASGKLRTSVVDQDVTMLAEYSALQRVSGPYIPFLRVPADQQDFEIAHQAIHAFPDESWTPRRSWIDSYVKENKVGPAQGWDQETWQVATELFNPVLEYICTGTMSADWGGDYRTLARASGGDCAMSGGMWTRDDGQPAEVGDHVWAVNSPRHKTEDVSFSNVLALRPDGTPSHADAEVTLAYEVATDTLWEGHVRPKGGGPWVPWKNCNQAPGASVVISGLNTPNERREPKLEAWLDSSGWRRR